MGVPGGRGASLAVLVGDDDVGLARGGRGDPERDPREAPHAPGLRLHELEVAPAYLLGYGRRGVGRDALGGALGGHVRHEGPDRGLVALWRPGLPYGDGAQGDDGVPGRVAVELVARGGREVRGAVLARGHGPGARCVLGEASLVVLTRVVADLELRTREAGGAERGGLARLGVGLGEHEAEGVRLRRVRRRGLRRPARLHGERDHVLRERVPARRGGLPRPVAPGAQAHDRASAVGVRGDRRDCLRARLVRIDGVHGSGERVAAVAVGHLVVRRGLHKLHAAGGDRREQHPLPVRGREPHRAAPQARPARRLVGLRLVAEGDAELVQVELLAGKPLLA